MRVVYTSPKDVEEAVEHLKGVIPRKPWIAFFGQCRVEYEGRAASRSTPGDKLVIIKPSGSVIVHGPKGFKPQNWQPDTYTITVSLENEELVLKAYRRRPYEILVVRCNRVYHIMEGYEALDSAFWMYINEYEIRDVLASKPSLIEDGLRITSVEKPVEPGFVDLYGRDSLGRLVVIELKRVKAGEEAVHQLLKYVEAFRKRGVDVRPILVAPDFTDSARLLASRSGVELKRIDLKSIYELVKSRERKKPGSLADFL
ncbi:MAG: endonuclease NucS [Desulfurococcales archaeon]|nr:endonuclease NucS [Desulfurococcales archaeon]